MDAQEWLLFEQAMIYALGPLVNLLTAFLLAAGILGGALGLALSMVQRRRRKTPSL